MQAGVDTGGTFTDCVLADGSVTKVLSRPADPAAAVEHGLITAGAPHPRLLAHGTTVATNALLEGAGATVALVTTEGLADVIEIARQDRPSLYDAVVERPPPLVPRELRFEVGGRLAADGSEVTPLDRAGAERVAAKLPAEVGAVAVCLLHADLDSEHEAAVASIFERAGFDTTRSSQVSPEFREYERSVTTVANGMLRPLLRSYLHRVGEMADTVLVMTSAGGLLPASDAGDLPVALLLSGPAGGARAAAALATAVGHPDAVSFDMGGTSTDVCLIRDGAPAAAAQANPGGYPIRMPALDIHTVGAGGGSIAFLDAGGALRVGPRSAGADPGPACYGRGGHEPTVTDADLALGRIPAGSPLPELAELDVSAARTALERGSITAEGVVAVVDAGMEQAVRRVSVERGVDPRGLALIAFGGAGPLHACSVADRLGMQTVIVPPRAGVFSAVGLLTSPRQRELVRSWPRPRVHDGLDEARAALGAEVATAVGTGAETETLLDCRYAGQSHEITAADISAFHREHERRNGFARAEAPVEVTAVRARGRLPAPVNARDLPVVDRKPSAHGPCVLAEADCTVWVPEGWRARLDDTAAWILERR